MVSTTQTTRKATVQPSISHRSVLCMGRAFATQVQTKAAAREMTASTMHQKAVAKISTRSFTERRPASLGHRLSILSVIFRQIFSPSCSSVFLASSLTVTVLAPYPVTMIQEHPEEGNTTYRYTYTKFDNHKNWIERKVSYTTEYDKYDDNGNYIGHEYTDPKEYTEKRTIEYW